MGLLQKNKTPFAVGTTYSCAFTSPNTAGSTLLAVSYYSSAGVPTVSDTAGNSGWTIVDRDATWTAGANTLVCFICQNCLSGANTVTLNTHGASGNGDLFIFEYPAAAASLDVHAIAQGNSAIPASGSITTSVPNETLFSYFATAADGNVIDASYTSQEDDISYLTAGDKLGATAGSYHSTHASTSGKWSAGILSLKPVSLIGTQPIVYILN